MCVRVEMFTGMLIYSSSPSIWYSSLPLFRSVGPDRESIGSKVEILTQDRGVAGSSLTGMILCCVLEQDTFILAYTCSNQEDPSQHNLKIVDWDVKIQIKKNQWVLTAFLPSINEFIISQKLFFPIFSTDSCTQNLENSSDNLTKLLMKTKN